MKRNVVFTLAVAFVMLFASCSKEVKLPGTTWKANFSNSATVQGISANVAMDLTLKFVDETKYKMDVTLTMSAFGQTSTESDSQDGTYTFDGENGVFDGEQSFTYNKDDKTITTIIELEDEDALMFGSNKITLTFTEQ
ncbi:MAG: hypothetical protein J6T88_00895 [Bacteroidales bacterium]|nr:hypothetical protein [Bacteroidales bacterium]